MLTQRLAIMSSAFLHDDDDPYSPPDSNALVAVVTATAKLEEAEADNQSQFLQYGGYSTAPTRKLCFGEGQWCPYHQSPRVAKPRENVYWPLCSNSNLHPKTSNAEGAQSLHITGHVESSTMGLLRRRFHRLGEFSLLKIFLPWKANIDCMIDLGCIWLLHCQLDCFRPRRDFW